MRRRASPPGRAVRSPGPAPEHPPAPRMDLTDHPTLSLSHTLRQYVELTKPRIVLL